MSQSEDPGPLQSTQQNLTQQNNTNQKITKIISDNYGKINLSQIFTLIREKYPNATDQKIRELYDAFEFSFMTSGILTQPEQHSRDSLEIRGYNFSTPSSSQNPQGGKRKKKSRKTKKSKKSKKIKKSKKRVHKIRV
jgi:hypothetical protein